MKLEPVAAVTDKQLTGLNILGDLALQQCCQAAKARLKIGRAAGNPTCVPVNKASNAAAE